MKLTVLASLAMLVAIAGGCGGGDEGVTPAATQTTSSTGDVPFDLAFIDAMVPHHEAAIEMAREAKDAGLSQPELVQIADNIVATQQREIDKMLEWRQTWFGSGEPGPEATALETLGLSSAEAGMEQHGMELSTADDVDQVFAEMMIAHHEGALRMAQLANERASHAELRDLAGEIVAAQQAEIDVMDEHAGAMHE